MEENVKDRLLSYLKYKGINRSEFGRSIGASAAFVSAIRASVGQDKLAKISNVYPDLNIKWLLTGMGEMLSQESPMPERLPEQIRYWIDIDATGGGVELFGDKDSNRFIDISIPEFKDCTDAVNLYGDSMSPLYKNGQIIILKQWTESFIDYGNVYLVITKKGNRMVKYLRQGSDSTRVLCVSENKDYDSFEIEKEDILQLFIVKGAISKNTM